MWDQSEELGRAFGSLLPFLNLSFLKILESGAEQRLGDERVLHRMGITLGKMLEHRNGCPAVLLENAAEAAK